MTSLDMRRRWLALYVLCLGDLMIVLDGTIVNVALPSIRDDLGFSQTSLAWVVNAYLLTFGGFLLLGGRLGDLFGHRRMFLSGIGLFTAASLACGVASSQEFLIAARAVQGLGGAVVSAVALSLLMMLFTEQADRAKAMGVFGFVLSGGGVVGVLAGGILTDLLSWNWIFLVNLPIGIAVFLLTLRLLPADGEAMATGRVDYAGAITVTGALMLAVYAIVNGNEQGWGSAQTLGTLGAAVALMVVFLLIESRIANPLMPLGIFRNRSVSTANILGALMAAGLFGYFFMSALHAARARLQPDGGRPRLPPGHRPLGRVVPPAVGSARHALRDQAAADHRPWADDARPPPVCAGPGGWQLARRHPAGHARGEPRRGHRVQPDPAGRHERRRPGAGRPGFGVVNTAFMMGGAVGLAALAAIADSRTQSLADSGEERSRR